MRDTAHGLKFVGQGVDTIRRELCADRWRYAVPVSAALGKALGRSVPRIAQDPPEKTRPVDRSLFT